MRSIMLDILYEDNYILVCVKPVGILSQPDPSGSKDMISILNGYLEEKNEKAEMGLVHRLDRNVGGVMVFSKKGFIAAKLSKLIQEGNFHKEYFAVVHNCPEEKSGVYKDFLFKDSSKNKTFVVDRIRKGVKEAFLEYQTLESKDTKKGIVSLVKIRLHTGRTHQIRVQFSSRKMPLLGDGKYGGSDNDCDIALWSYKLVFWHPVLKKEMEFTRIPPDCYPWNLFDIDSSKY
jgi:23S rRNA pseudouridine1911/1915/1917 synthase